MTHASPDGGEAAICASVELVAAMRGGIREWDEASAAWFAPVCGAPDNRNAALAIQGSSSKQSVRPDTSVVTCPACLVAMRSATDPVRYDYLHARGLVP